MMAGPSAHTGTVRRDARRHFRRLLALVLPRGAGRARRARRPARARLGLDLRGLGAGRGLGARPARRPDRADRARLRPAADPRPASRRRRRWPRRRSTCSAAAASASGLGVSGPQVSRGLVRRAVRQAAVTRTREYVEIVRQALARKPLEYEGREYTLPLPGGQGSGAAEAARQAGAGADPGLPRGGRPARGRADRRDRRRLAAVHVRPAARRHAVRAARPRPGERAGGRAPTSTSPRPSRSRSTKTWARRATRSAPGWPSTSARWARARRTSTSSSPSGPVTARPRAPARTRCCSGHREAAAAALSDELVDAMTLATTPAGLDDRARRLEAAG